VAGSQERSRMTSYCSLTPEYTQPHLVELNESWVDRACAGIIGEDRDKKGMRDVVNKYKRQGFFSKIPGLVKGVEHEIDTKNSTPYKPRPRPMNAAKRHVLDETLDRLLEEDIIERSDSEWGCNPVLVPKNKNKNAAPNFRLCVDYRPVNARTILNIYVMPRSDYILSQLGKAKYFSVIDLTQGYHQILMKPEDRHKTAFITPHRGSF
jgi:hypothetical protein